MVFRVPSHFESFIPPPSEQQSQPAPWRGTIIVSGIRNSDRNAAQQIFVTAVETDGEKAEQWPSRFFVRLTNERPILRDLQAWVQQYKPPLCTFMPDRLRDSNAHTVNQAAFRSLSRVLFENYTVAIAPWGPDTFPGAGIIIYPAQNTSALLVGALFFYNSFPDFVGGIPSPTIMSPSTISVRNPHYQQAMIASSSYASSSPHYTHTHSTSPHRSNPNSPIEQPIATHSRDPYRAIMPRPVHYSTPTSSSGDTAAATWPVVKAEDESIGYNTFSPTHQQQNPPYP